VSDAVVGLIILAFVVMVFPALSFLLTPLGALALGAIMLILAADVIPEYSLLFRG